ncbi:MAG: replication-associated recombination protein A [Oscillospiraceae bacterium]|nr:replication-associated recombination protein A [Candidatus Equicaccousia limihippi]
MASPLADRIRPTGINDVVGQRHILDNGKALRKIIDSGEISNLIFYGPSGVGKTTVANIFASKTGKKLFKLNATTASTADIKEVIAHRDDIDCTGGILMYLDEIQYFNKRQQQILLEYIENGDITLIASTTENPYFYVYKAILSRSTVFEFKLLSPQEVAEFMPRAYNFMSDEKGIKIEVGEGVCQKLGYLCAGDLRRAITTAELSVTVANDGKKAVITTDIIEELSKSGGSRYDRDGDEHYDIVSAYQKSMRGGDPDAALHYLARLLEAGDLPSATRRLMVCACEDVGLAYPQIIPIVKAAVDSALMVGLPEAQIPLADAVILVCLAPKSNSGCVAIEKAWADVKSGKSGEIPRHLQNVHYDGEGAEVVGQNYKYPHSFKNHYVKQQYLPDNLKNVKYYTPGDNKTERQFKEYYDKIRKE